MEFPQIPDEQPESPVSYYFEDVQFDLPEEEQLTAWLMLIPEQEGKRLIALNFIFCSDEHLRAINVQYLDHDYYTDVITFPYADDAIHGDIFISADRVRDNAATLGASFDNELMRVMAHGVLHLAGYGDKTPEEKKRMSAREDFFLQQSPLF